jgi:hypothetical protein
MTNEFFPKTCEWSDWDTNGNIKLCTSPRTHIVEPELRVYCDFHYKVILKLKKEKS